eukprot:gene16175-7538_t
MSPINVKLELHFNGEILSTADDRKLVGQIPFKDRTIITVKLGAVGGSSPSSPDSSSDSSPPPTPQPGEGPNLEAEHCLPGVVMSKMKFANSLFLLGDLGMKHNIPELRDIALSLLNIIPTDVDTIRKTRLICEDRALKGSKSNVNLDILFFTPTPINVLYNLQVVYSLLMPSAQPCNEISTNFQLNFISAGGIKAVINMLTKSSFMSNADTLMQRSAYQTLLKIAKLMFTVIGYAQVQHVAEALQKEPGRELTITAQQHSAALVLQSALKSIPNLCQECVVRNIAYKLGLALSQQAIACIPDMNVIEVLQRLAWVSAVGFTVMAQAPLSEVHLAFEKGSQCQIEPEDIALAREALEVLTIAIMLFPSALDSLTKDRQWQLFINDMILICRSRTVRVTAAEQFFLMATKCTNGDKPIRFFIQLLFTVRDTVASEHAGASCEYFGLLCRLLNFGRINELQLNNSEAILGQEISWLASVWEKAINSDDGREIVNNELLEGHLGITRELLSYQTPQKRYFIGSDPDGHKLLRHLTDDFIFSGSRLAVEAKRGGDIFSRHVNPICETPGTIVTALDLLVSLCSGCVLNLRILSQILIEMYYEGIDLPLTEWEYQPPIGPRPARGFVGLKNAGATCYMNSVIQQLYMIPEIRAGILEVDVGPLENEDEHLESDEKTDKESFSILSYNKDVEKSDRKSSMEVEKTKEQERKEYNQKVLRQVQGIFGHLLESKLQFHIPRGFWKTFRLWGEPVNLREQHDALEFFNSLVENLDEGLKALNKKGMLTEVLGGSFADQKICKTCPHRYSRETPFTALNVDVRNHHTLIDSLEQYVKGDLLEGANAYHCERCDKKVDTVKRMCIKKLPKVLAIHLKRFDYDWERDCAIKFNDYFEFPRQFDMEPFTVEGLAKIEGEIVEDDRCEEKDKDDVEKETIEVPGSTVYNLVGVVVHSGQASGGHYYSYIIPRPSVDGESRWYKFDDGDVSECIMDEDEMKNQCFGGEYMGEVFDHMLKRMSYRRQKRWWNAYILFYERLDVCGKADRTDPQKGFKMEMPGVIERSVRRQNILFMHNRTQFSAEYFQFIKKLVMSNTATFQSMNQHYLSKISQAERDELALLSLQLLCKFLFMVGFHTKKNIRGPASEWGEVLSGLLKQSAKLRQWFAIEVLLSHPERMVEYLIDCPVAEIRSAFAKVIVYLAHATRQDGLWNAKLLNRPIEILTSIRLDPETSTLSDYILKCVLELINKDVTDSSKYLVQYFQLFVMYVGFGVPERKQLLDLGVLQTFIRLAFEDERSSTSRYPYSELTKLYSLVSILIRSCDVSKSMKSSIEDNDPKPNRFYDSLIDHPIMPIPQDVEGLIYTSNYVKKLLEESASSEETICLLKFLSWECLSFSLIALSEVLFQISYTYSYELRPYLDILLHLLLMEDSWQTQRLHHAFRVRLKTPFGCYQFQSAKLRQWFAIEVLLSHPERMVEYLIDCPVAEIRSAFAKVIVYLAHATRQDGLWNAKLLNRPIEILTSIRLDPETSTLSDYILKCVLELINKDVTDSSKYLVQYFQLFVMYVGFGVPERKQLLDLGVLQTFIRLAFEDERSSTSRYPYSELTKLYSLVSILIRSCDVSKSMKSSIEDNDPKPNRFYDSLIDHPIMPIPQDVEGLIYTSNYVKKLLEESASSEETICLLKFLSWECLSFSLIALSEVLFQISYTYSYELRPYLDILLHLLLMEDSWQTQRLHHAFRGVSEDREGLFDTIQRSKAHSQKRGYQCIKAIVQLLNNSETAVKMIKTNEGLKQRWNSAIQWLGDELERRAPSAYNYNNWSPPTQSNETSNGYFLERSQSARMTYTKAREFFEEEEEEPELEGDAEAPIESEEKNESPTNKLQNNQLSPKENADCSSRDSDSILQYVKDQKAQTDKISDKIPQIDF